MRRIKKVVYFVKASDFETFVLWNEHKDIWKEINTGDFFQIGEIEGFPIFVSINYAYIKNHLVAFYECTSQMCDSDQVEDYIKSFKKPMTDAMNFNHLINYINEISNRTASNTK